MRFASLGSGSEGNALIVEASDGAAVTRIMLDCGFGLRDVEQRLMRLGLEPGNVDAIVVTHEHGDHMGGVPRFARKHRIPVWMTYGTYVASGLGSKAHASPKIDALEILLIDHHTPFSVGSIQILPFPVPHDAREPAQYAFSDGARRLGVLTDLGSVTAHVTSMLSRCDGLVLECNHDVRMLADGPYPTSLKARVGGAYGHLDNQQAAQLLKSLVHSGLQHVIAAHLSRQNNTPALAQAALAGALGCEPDWVGIADQEEGFGWRSL